MCYRFSVGLPFVYPNNDISFPANFLTMMWKVGDYEVDPRLERAMDVLFILHADHEQNCGTTAMRVVGSSQADPYSAAASAASALYGPLHGGANEAVVRMLEDIGSVENVPAFIASVKEGKGRLMGFGHRVYKNYDPRATIVKQTAYDVFEVTGKNPLLDIALKLEETALSDDYFISRKLYPNVDFYSGLIYQALGFPWRCSPCCSPSHGPPDGSLTGRSCSPTRTRRSAVRASGTPGRRARLRAHRAALRLL
jgi:citrate synthase